MKIISASIDLSKIDKSQIVEGKQGAKYYNFDIIVNNTTDKFGNHVSLLVRQTKEERQAKEKRKYIGNGKIVFSNDENVVRLDKEQEKPWKAQDNSDDLPF